MSYLSIMNKIIIFWKNNKGKRGFSASKFLFLFISIVFYVEIKIQCPQFFGGSNRLDEKFGQRGISDHFGQ
jgi:hypothetical protein